MCPYFESGHFMYSKNSQKLDLYNFKCLEQQIVCGRSLTLVSVLFLFCHRLNIFFFYVNINFNDKIVDQERLTVSRLM